MPISNPKAADDVLRARDAQTVVTSGIDAGPADDADMEESAAAKQMAGDRLTSRLWGPLLIGLGVVLIVALAIIAS